MTVLASTAAEADALSTAFSLLGPEQTRSILADRPEVGVIFVHGNVASLAPRVETIHLSDSDYTSNVIDPDRPQKFRPND